MIFIDFINIGNYQKETYDFFFLQTLIFASIFKLKDEEKNNLTNFYR